MPRTTDVPERILGLLEKAGHTGATGPALEMCISEVDAATVRRHLLRLTRAEQICREGEYAGATFRYRYRRA